MAWWGFCLALSVLALLALAFAVIQPVPKDGSAPLDELIAAIRMKGPATALTVALLVAIAFFFRQIWFDWLALRPGRIEVEPFTAGGALADVDVEQLTLAFRQRLAELHLHAPAGTPGNSAEGTFLDVLGRSAVDSRNWFASAIAVLRAAKPNHAWHVRGVLVRRDSTPRFGLTVQVVRLPDSGNPPETLWGNTWDDAVRQGADHATAAILPRTKRCTQQWAAWRRFRMGGKLLGNYEDGVEFEGVRRYDEALQAYYLAARDDPMNMALRLRIGQLQERMGLYLDALATYMGMMRVAKERVRGRTLERPTARWERRRALLAARYRRLVLLGGSELAEQWLRVDALGTGPQDESDSGSQDEPESERAERRRLLRDRVEPLLRKELETVAERHEPAPYSDHVWRAVAEDRHRPRRHECTPGQALCPGRDGPVDDDSADERLFRLRELFGLLALSDANDLVRHLAVHRRERRLRRRDRRLILSRETVQITARCIEVRLDWVQYNLAREQSNTWPPPPERLDKQLERIEDRAGFKGWHEQYNAACLYALPLLAFDRKKRGAVALNEDLRREFAKRAVDRLAKATANADSAYVAGRSDWLLSEDPDLDGLRVTNDFKQFEAMNFPSREPTPYRPLHVKTLESSRYVRDLLEATARCWENTWHLRGRLLDQHPDVHELLGWWKDECEAWKQVRRVALNTRCWQARADLLGLLRDHADAFEVPRREVAFPRYADAVLAEKQLGKEEAHRRKAAERVARLGEHHLHRIGRTIWQAEVEGQIRPRINDIEKWQAVLRQLDARGREPRRFLLALLCDHHAALWQLLAEWVGAPPGAERREKKDAFVTQVGETDQIWCGADSWWRSRVLVRAAAHRGAKPALVFGRWASNNGVKQVPSSEAPTRAPKV